MKKLSFLWMFVALLALTACYREAPDNDPVGIAMIVKNGQIDYFRQIETSFRSICEEKDLDKMNWTALRQDLGGDPYTVTFEMKKVTGAIPE